MKKEMILVFSVLILLSLMSFAYAILEPASLTVRLHPASGGSFPAGKTFMVDLREVSLESAINHVSPLLAGGRKYSYSGESITYSGLNASRVFDVTVSQSIYPSSLATYYEWNGYSCPIVLDPGNENYIDVCLKVCTTTPCTNIGAPLECAGCCASSPSWTATSTFKCGINKDGGRNRYQIYQRLGTSACQSTVLNYKGVVPYQACLTGQVYDCIRNSCLDCADESAGGVVCDSLGKIICYNQNQYTVCGNTDTDICYELGATLTTPAGTICQNGAFVGLTSALSACQLEYYQAWNVSDSVGYKAYGVAVDSDDNVIVTGYRLTGSSDYYTVKYNSTGSQVWNKTDSVGDIAYGVAVDSQDNVIVTGTTGSADYYTVKYNSTGSQVWNKTDSFGQYAYGVAVDSEDNVIVTGYAGFLNRYYTVKYNSSGSQVWTKIDNSVGYKAYGVAVDSDDNVIVTGKTENYNYYTVKYDSAGSQVWTKTDGFGQVAYGVAVDSEDNVIVTGHNESNRYYTVKYNSSGSQVWTKTDSVGYIAQGVAVDSEDNVIVSGYKIDNSVYYYYTVKYDSAGSQVLWAKTDGVGQYAYGVAVDSEDNVIVTGYNGSNRYYTVKYGVNKCEEQTTIVPPTCLLTEAYWENASGTKLEGNGLEVMEGKNVSLVVEGTECAGQVIFNISEADYILIPPGYTADNTDTAKLNIKTLTAIFSSGKAKALWTAEWVGDDELLIGSASDSEYLFTATAGTEEIESADVLEVNKSSVITTPPVVPPALKELGESCSSSLPCKSGLICSGGICKKEVGLGEICNATRVCQAGLSCINNTCNTIIIPCQSDTDCANNFICISNNCIPLEDECQDSDECDEGESCEDVEDSGVIIKECIVTGAYGCDDYFSEEECDNFDGWAAENTMNDIKNDDTFCNTNYCECVWGSGGCGTAWREVDISGNPLETSGCTFTSSGGDTCVAGFKNYAYTSAEPSCIAEGEGKVKVPCFRETEIPFFGLLSLVVSVGMIIVFYIFGKKVYK